MARHYLLYGSERYALAILRPLQAAIRARGDVAVWFFDGPGGGELQADEPWLRTTREVRAFDPRAVLTSSNAVPHFFPGVKAEVFHGFDAGKPRHIYIRGFFDLYCTTGPGDTAAFEAEARKLGHFAVRETGWPKLDPFMRLHGADQPPPVRAQPVILYHSTFSPSWSAAPILYDTVRELSRGGRWRWIVALHPKTDPETVARYRALANEYLRFSDEDNILDLFPQVDLMISDTSCSPQSFRGGTGCKSSAGYGAVDRRRRFVRFSAPLPRVAPGGARSPHAAWCRTDVQPTGDPTAGVVPPTPCKSVQRCAITALSAGRPFAMSVTDTSGT